MVYVTPDLIEANWPIHKIEYYKENGRYYHMLGKYISGENVLLELDMLLKNTKEPFSEEVS